jgi:hypothetical protein
VPKPGVAAELMARALQRQGYTRTEALQAVSAACEMMLERYAGVAALDLAFVRDIREAAEHRLSAMPPVNVLPMSGQGTKKGKAK